MVRCRTPVARCGTSLDEFLAPPSCLRHGEEPATAACRVCGAPVCDLCRVFVGYESTCPRCVHTHARRRVARFLVVLSLANLGVVVVGLLFAFLALKAVRQGELAPWKTRSGAEIYRPDGVGRLACWVVVPRPHRCVPGQICPG